MDKKARNTIIISIIALALVLITVTYAYFSARITGIESASTISLTAGTMTIHYTEGNEDIVLAQNIYPREEAWATKTFTLIGNNSTSLSMEYQVGLEIFTNTFKGGQLSYSLEVAQGNDGTSMSAVTNKAIVGSDRTILIGKGSFPANTLNGTQTYTLKIYFLDNGRNQNINQGAVFNARIAVGDKGSIIVIDTTRQNHNGARCYTDDYVEGVTPVTGKEYTKSTGQYTYKYNYYYFCEGPGRVYENTTQNGWGAYVTNKNSTDPLTEEFCAYINDVPVNSMRCMFGGSQATSIDLSSFDTSHVTDMQSLFAVTAATSLDLSSFDTSGITSMYCMFCGSAATTLDVSSFDTSKVTSMGGMFRNSAATTLDVSSFDTSNVTNMAYMFEGSSATSLNLSSFDTSKVTDMSFMFRNNSSTTLDLSSFDTSNVTNMANMFEGSAATTLDLSSFDTSKVTSMHSMFSSSAATTLDLSSFDTSNVIYMYQMFSGSAATIGYAQTQADANKFNASSDKPSGLTFVVK